MATQKQLAALKKARAAKAKKPTSTKRKTTKKVTKTDKQKDTETFKKTGFYYLSSPKDALKLYFLKNANEFSEIDMQNNMPYGILHNGRKVKTVKKGTIYVLRETKPTAKRTSKLSGTPEKYEIIYKEKTGKQWTSKNYVTTKASVKMYLEQFLADFDYNKNFSVIKITKPKS